MAVVTTQPFAMAGNQIFPMGQQKRPWSQGLCECYKKPLICLCGLCLGPCLFCTTVDKLGENGFKYFCLSYCCGCPMGVAARSLARDKYNIMDTYSNDAINATCCAPCSVCQIASEIENNNY
ncbi:hypothetical protein TCAL_13438 [Tigriopus californicus]|uniref:Uncharacterized protein n=1 Tax=Tigriopus californicus TaxID=6832 RepID=A0A553PKP3_TIGCA|nr:placenta-specific gene 8 protein-like [Tigriopus californicus]TRY78254.1 hypothetical protein TCAL_13438 [Tigriopus californicus]